MATVHTVNSTSTLYTTNVVVNAPTGIQINDVLIAVIGGEGGGVTAAPSGWTLSHTNSNANNPFLPYIYFYYKTAVLADVSASNYTWITAVTDGAGGVILRTTGIPIASDPLFTEFDIDAAYNSTANFSYSPTLVRPTPSLLIIAGVAEGDEITHSNYSITQSTANPTWTEVLDVNDASSDEMSFFCAYAVTSDVSNITAVAFDITTSATGNPAYSAISLAVYCDINNQTGTNALLSVSPTIFTNAGVQVDGNGTTTLLEVQPNLPTQSGRSDTPTVWTPEVKTATTWTPEIK